jgi:hypothetical protein
MNDLLTYIDSTTDEIFESPAPAFEKFDGFTENQGNVIITFEASAAKISAFKEAVNYYSSFLNKKEEYCIKAIKNLIKKNNFLELSLELSENQISEDEFEMEIESNPNKFVVDINYIKDALDLKVINEIVKKLETELTIDEVAEIFSLDSNDIEKAVKQLNK